MTYCTFCTAEATHIVIDTDGDRSPLCASCTDAFYYALACISPSVVPIEQHQETSAEGDDCCDYCMTSGVQITHTLNGKTICDSCLKGRNEEE